jgi:hypothetical protein
MVNLKTRIKILLGIYNLPSNISELLEIKSAYDELLAKYETLEQERRDEWIKYCDWCELVADRYRRQTEFLLEANESLAKNVSDLSKSVAEITAKQKNKERS